MDNFRSGSTPQAGAYAPKPTQPATPQRSGSIKSQRPPAEPVTPSRSPFNKDGINLAALGKLQNILKDYPDVSALTTQQQSELKTRLQRAGLTRTGSVLHIIA